MPSYFSDLPADARLNLDDVSQRNFLAWILDQFLYGEATGIQCGLWIYRAPSIRCAQFLARQTLEEFSHLNQFKRIYQLLSLTPSPPHWITKLLSSGMIGQSWGEHVVIEMALGEGLVLQVLHLLERLVPQPQIKQILHTILLDEVKHSEFGLEEAKRWVEVQPKSKKPLLAQALIQLLALRLFRKSIEKRLCQQLGNSHPVVLIFPDFYNHLLREYQRILGQMGLTKGRDPHWLQWPGILLSLAVDRTLRLARRITALIIPAQPAILTNYLLDEAERGPKQN